MGKPKGYIGGVPAYVLREGFQGTVKALSGGELYCSIERDKVWITGQTHPGQFWANIQTEKGDRGNVRALKLSIETRSRKGVRHPDIYAGRLLRASLAYFERAGRVEQLQAVWMDPPDYSVNYDQYTTYLKRRHWRSPNQTQKVEAAQHTWTGMQAHSLGFTAVRGIWRADTGAIHVQFERP